MDGGDRSGSGLTFEVLEPAPVGVAVTRGHDHRLVSPKGPHWRLLSTTTDLDPVWLQYLGEGAA